MALCMQRAPAVRGGVMASARPVRGLAPLVRCSATPEPKQETMVAKLGGAVAAVTAASVLITSIQMAAPAEALAARSGGRAGASSFSARRAMPRAAPAQRMAPAYSSTVVVAPPVFSPFGFGGFGYGFGYGMPIPFFGGFLQLMFLMLMVSVVFNVIKSALGGGGNKSNSKGQDWDDL
jgi:uncharacterized membrane protein